MILLGVKPIIVFDGPAPDLKRRTLMERFKQRYNSEKNYKKVAQRFVMNALENKKARKFSAEGSSQQEHSNSQSNESAYLRQLTEEQEAEILKLLEEYETALEEREFEEVGLLLP